MESYIDNYVGEWADPYGRRLRITKVNATTVSVSLFAQLAANHGFTARELNVIRRLIGTNYEIIIEAWHEHCG